MRKGFALAFLAVPVGMVLAFAVSYLSYNVGIPRFAFVAPGIVAGFGAVWLFRRKVGDVTTKGIVRLAIVGVVSAVFLVVAALAGDAVVIMGEVGSQYLVEGLIIVVKANVVWYALFAVCNFAGLFGALRTLK